MSKLSYLIPLWACCESYLMLAPDVEKVAAPGHLVPRRNLSRRRILSLITAFVVKIIAEEILEVIAEVLAEGPP